MKFEEIVENLNCFLENPVIFNEEQLKKIQTSVKVMLGDFDLMMKGENVEQTNEKIVGVVDATLMTSGVVLECPLSDAFSTFITSYSELVFNWNGNLYKDELLRQLPLYMGRIIETRNEINKSVLIVKDIDERMRDLAAWCPPAYEVATDYFEKLLEENEKE